jgi:ABC-type amino acid transport substrate-binding protein
MRKSWIGIILLVLGLTVTAQADTLTFTADKNAPPFHYMKDGTLTGAAADILRQACFAAGFQARFQVGSQARALDLAQRGMADGVFAVSKTRARGQGLIFPDTPLCVTRNAVFAKKGSNLYMNQLTDMDNKRVGALKGHPYGTQFRNYNGYVELVEYDSLRGLSQALVQGTIDLAAAEEMGFAHVCKWKCKKIYDLADLPLYVAFSAKNQRLTDKFNRALRILWEDGAIERIMERYAP